MNNHIHAITGLLLIASVANGQYATLWIGTPDGPSTSLANTPFPTEVARAARTQYLVRSQQLQDVGLWPNHDIQGICLPLVDDDALEPDCLVDLHVQMKNESTPSLTDLVYSGLVTTTDTSDVHLDHGILGLHSNTSPWQWLGVGNNMIVEINWERGEAAGISPRILLDMGMSYTSTYSIRTEQAVLGASLVSTIPGVEMDSDNSLPILGLLVEEGVMTSIHPTPPAQVPELSLNANGDLLTVKAPLGTRSLQVVDVCGRTVLNSPVRSSTTQLGLDGIPDGCYFVSCLSGGEVISTGRFIKQ